jgi:hypothetical protein
LRRVRTQVTEIGFAPKEIIPQEVCRLEIVAADKADTYGPQIYLKLKVVGGEHDGHTFNDYSNRDEDTGQIKQGSKAWSIFEACLGQDFHKKAGVSLESLIVGPVPPEGVKTTPTLDNDDDEDDVFADLPF